MPIYAYRCTNCGFEKDVLQKMSDMPLTACPQCKTENFSKQVTAAGFHLKGSGWYATDFKGGNKTAAGSATDARTEAKTENAVPASAPATPVATPAPAKTESTST